MKKINKKFRISYSLINLWRRGLISEAIACYFHIEQPTTKAMKDGKKIHKTIEEFIKENKSLPKFLIPVPLKNPQVELKFQIPFNELFDLSCVFDCLDEPNLFEWKTGTTTSLEWARTLQIPFYFLASELMGFVVNKAYIVRYNQHTRNKDFVIIHKSPKLVEYGRNLVESLGFEIREYFLKEGLI